MSAKETSCPSSSTETTMILGRLHAMRLVQKITLLHRLQQLIG